MNIPYLEHRVISIVVETENIRWMELSKVGNKVSVIQHDYFTFNGADINRIEYFEQIASSIQADVFKVALCCPEALVHIQNEEIPFFDDEEQTQLWVANKEQEVSEQFSGEDFAIRSHVSQIDEEVRQLTLQLVDKGIFSKLKEELESVGLRVSYYFSGASENAYAMTLGDTFNDGLSGVISEAGEKKFLNVFSSGLLQTSHILTSEEEDKLYTIKEADSLLRTEEQTRQIDLGSSLLYLNNSASVDIQRKMQAIFIENGSKEKPEISADYTTCFGTGVKAFYPGLDEFEFIDEQTKINSKIAFDQRVFKKTAVLLSVPAILILLIIYSWNSVVGHQLQETSQVMGAIESKLELVEQTRDDVQLLYAQYKDVEDLLDQKTNTAKIFAILNETTNDDIELTELNLTVSNSNEASLVIQGMVSERSALSGFMKRLTSHQWVSSTELLSGSQGNNNEGLSFSIRAGVDVW